MNRRARLALALALPLLACGRDEPPLPDEPPPSSSAAGSAEPVERPAAAPAPAPAPDASSAALPDDLPLYAQAIPISSMASRERGTIVNLSSQDAPEVVFGWYRDEFAKRGWVVEKQSGAGGQHLVTAIKGGRKATLLVSQRAKPDVPGASETRILLTVIEER